MRQRGKKIKLSDKETWIRCDPVASLDRSRNFRRYVINGGDGDDIIELRYSVPFRRSYDFLRVRRLHRRTFRGWSRRRWWISRSWKIRIRLLRRRRFRNSWSLLWLLGNLCLRNLKSVSGWTEYSSWLNHWFNRRTKLWDYRHICDKFWGVGDGEFEGNVRVKLEIEVMRFERSERNRERWRNRAY